MLAERPTVLSPRNQGVDRRPGLISTCLPPRHGNLEVNQTRKSLERCFGKRLHVRRGGKTELTRSMDTTAANVQNPNALGDLPHAAA
jgi:hypothetical protein